MLIIYMACLTVTMIVLEDYAISGFYSHRHRFLPLVLCLIGVYDFYIIVQYFTGADQVFHTLKDLLLMQAMYLIFHYIMDFMMVKTHRGIEMLVFLCWISANLVVLNQMGNNEEYGLTVIIFVLLLLAITFVIATVAFLRKSISNIDKRVYRLLYLALLIPMMAIIYSILWEKPDVIIGVALACTCLIFEYLMRTNYLIEISDVVRDEMLQTVDIPVFMFDKDFYYLDANISSKQLFSETVRDMEKNPKAYVNFEKLRQWGLVSEEDHEVEVEDRCYDCRLHKVYYHGRIYGYFVTLIDISEQKNKIYEMEKQKLEAEINAAQKGVFLANMSHDLRSPLHAIIDGSEIILGNNEMSISTRVMVGHIHKAGQNLLQIVNSILDFSKLGAGKLNLNNGRYNFRRLVHEQGHMCYVNLMKKPIEFEMRLVSEYPEHLYGDEVRVRSIIQNILSNAVKFTEKGHIICSVFTERRDNKCFVEVTVEDTGMGMDQKHLDTIFGEYVSYADYQAQEGTGLGLNIVRQLCEMMGGTVTADSDGQSGFKICVNFYQEYCGQKMCKPVVISNDDMTENALSWNKKKNDPSWCYPDAKVLMADDMDVNRSIFKELTKPWKFKLDMVADGSEAVEKVRENKYDLIILDQMMPKMNGVEARDEIKKICDTPVVMLTADISDSMKLICKEHGFSGQLNKPLDLEEFETMLNEILPENMKARTSSAFLEVSNQPIVASAGYYRALESYIRETAEILNELEEYAEKDIDTFKKLVHGIKGTSRGLNRNLFSELAEILEMAAITENKDFINRRVHSFVRDGRLVIENAEQELAIWKEYSNKLERRYSYNEIHEVATKEDILMLWKLLKDAFDTYDIGQIEVIVKKIEKLPLSPEETSVLQKIKEASEILEYEDGSRILELHLSS